LGAAQRCAASLHYFSKDFTSLINGGKIRSQGSPTVVPIYMVIPLNLFVRRSLYGNGNNYHLGATATVERHGLKPCAPRCSRYNGAKAPVPLTGLTPCILFISYWHIKINIKSNMVIEYFCGIMEDGTGRRLMLYPLLVSFVIYARKWCASIRIRVSCTLPAQGSRSEARATATRKG
jgi:hypothetical protein